MKNANATKQGVSVGTCFKAAEGDDAAYGDVRDRFLALGGKASEWHTRMAHACRTRGDAVGAHVRGGPAGAAAGGAAATGVRALAVRSALGLRYTPPHPLRR